ncbi:MAG TPA: hypothetical protein ENJ30_12590 [Desulfobulbaceae bacterium]|nr:hypothetical protein [Desulfobulbaceae bacterium]
MDTKFEDVVFYYKQARKGALLRVEQTDCDGVTEVRIYRLPRLYQECSRFMDYVHDHAEGLVVATYIHPADVSELTIHDMPEYMTTYGESHEQ